MSFWIGMGKELSVTSTAAVSVAAAIQRRKEQPHDCARQSSRTNGGQSARGTANHCRTHQNDFSVSTVYLAALPATVLLPLHRRYPEIANSGAPHRHHSPHSFTAMESGPMAWARTGSSGIERNLFPSLDHLAGRRTNRLGGKRGSG